MRYLSLFSGIEAASVAWHGLGWTPVAFAEVEPFPSAVLAERFPGVPNFGDVTKFKEWPDACGCDDLLSIRRDETSDSLLDIGGIGGETSNGSLSSFCGKCGGIYAPDIIVGGSPCQSFSVAGLRKGMDDPRGNLALTYLAIVDKYRPKWIVWENVPGVLSSNRGRDFGSFIGALDEIGYGYAWRVLDAQYCRTPDYPRAVPQRRRRVFVIGSLRSAGCAGAVLFDSESLCGNPSPSRTKRQRFTANAQEGIASKVSIATESDDEPLGVLYSHRRYDGITNVTDVSETVVSKWGTGGGNVPFVREIKPDVIAYENHGNDSRIKEIQEPISPTVSSYWGTGGNNQALIQAINQEIEVSPPLQARDYKDSGTDGFNTSSAKLVAASDVGQIIPLSTMNIQGRPSDDGRMGSGIGDENDPSFTLSATHHHAVAAGDINTAVRRLTPLECERLQGFPDYWTKISWRNKEPKDCPDSPRYKAIGNSMAVNVMQWIGIRLAMVEEILNDQD